MDWQEQLRALRDLAPEAPADDADSIVEPQPESAKSRQHDRLDIGIERKGRAGKTATLITGWQLPDDELRQIAATLKQRLGSGGSARGGDILIQGDRRTQLLQLLTEMGFKARII